MIASTNALAAKLILLNPIAQVIQDVRYNLITTETITVWNYLKNPIAIAIPFAITLIVLIIGAIYFRRASKFFAEEI